MISADVAAARRPVGWAAAVPRGFVGVVLLATGVGKLLDLPGFVPVVAAFDLLPSGLVAPFAYLLPFVELATAAGLLTTVRLRAAAWAAVGLHAMLLSAVLVTLYRGIPIDNCGCFGVFLARPLTGATVIEDAVMLALSAVIVWQQRTAGMR